jgi:hypothetical protein
MNKGNEVTNLYIINEVLYDYTDGMVVIAAASLERARELFAALFAGGSLERELNEFDAAIERGAYKTLQVVGQSEGIVSYVYGGG